MSNDPKSAPDAGVLANDVLPQVDEAIAALDAGTTHFYGEVEGDPFPFEPLDLSDTYIDPVLAQAQGNFGGERLEAIDRKLMAGGLPLYDRALSATEFCNALMFTATSDDDSYVRVVVEDPSTGRYSVIRRTESLLEAEAFLNLIDIAGYHPNALPARIH